MEDNFNLEIISPEKIIFSGKAKMVTDDSFYEALGKAFPDPESENQSDDVVVLNYLYDKKNKLYHRNKVIFDASSKHFTFLGGTPISDIIEQVILLSDYGHSIAKKESEPGKTDWFRVQPKVFQMQDSSIAQATGRHPQIFAYTVIVYKVISDIFLSPTDQANAVATLENQVKKVYNYYYTGENLKNQSKKGVNFLPEYREICNLVFIPKMAYFTTNSNFFA